MIALLKFLFTGHLHKWIIHEEHRVSGVNSFGKETGEFWSRAILRCEKCGEMKHVDFRS